MNVFMAMGITTALKIKNNKKQYSVNIRHKSIKLFYTVMSYICPCKNIN